MRRRTLGAVLALALVAAGAAPALARPGWKRRIDRVVSGKSVGVSVWRGATRVYEHAPRTKRVPASNQKLLTSMALLDALGRRQRLPTIAAARSLRDGVVLGNLWVLGRGDPTVGTEGRFSASLALAETRVGHLARRIAAAGVRAVRGRVIGSTGYFVRDWDAPGWRPYYRARYIALPTALTFEGNTRRGRPVLDPERRLAARLTTRLEAQGVRVAGRPGARRPPRGLTDLARVKSPSLGTLLGHMNRTSSNFFAEVLGKRLAVARRGPPGSIAGGARAIAAWALRRGVRVTAHDASGLSYANRISARGLVRLLQAARDYSWGRTLLRSLPTPGRGTLEERLTGVTVRAKTGTLDGISALSGWVWLRRHRRWAEFSIMSRGLPKSSAVAMEDRIVRILSRSGRAAVAQRAPTAPLTWTVAHALRPAVSPADFDVGWG
jgi:serine-type D-Ala-D-Ala carboxypeptidase/endopeptidase (penicillin-binding protein 4)